MSFRTVIIYLVKISVLRTKAICALHPWCIKRLRSHVIFCNQDLSSWEGKQQVCKKVPCAPHARVRIIHISGRAVKMWLRKLIKSEQPCRDHQIMHRRRAALKTTYTFPDNKFWLSHVRPLWMHVRTTHTIASPATYTYLRSVYCFHLKCLMPAGSSHRPTNSCNCTGWLCTP